MNYAGSMSFLVMHSVLTWCICPNCLLKEKENGPQIVTNHIKELVSFELMFFLYWYVHLLLFNFQSNAMKRDRIYSFTFVEMLNSCPVHFTCACQEKFICINSSLLFDDMVYSLHIFSNRKNRRTIPNKTKLSISQCKCEHGIDRSPAASMVMTLTSCDNTQVM